MTRAEQVQELVNLLSLRPDAIPGSATATAHVINNTLNQLIALADTTHADLATAETMLATVSIGAVLLAQILDMTQYWRERVVEDPSETVQGLLASSNVSDVLTALGFTTFIKTLFDDEDASTALTTLGISSFAKTLLDDADASTALTTLGISVFAKTLLDDADTSTALSTLGVSSFIKTLLDDADISTAQSTLGISTFIKTLLDDTDVTTAQSTLGISSYAKTLLDDVDISAALSTLGVSTFIKTLLDNADVGTAQSTLGISTYVKTLLDDADAGTAQSTLGISSYVKTLLDDTDAATARTTLAAAPDTLPGFRNRIINGNFNIWQRGTSLGSGTGKRYLADRWANDSNGSTYTVSQQTFTLGQTNVSNEPIYFHRTVVTSVANAANYAGVRHIIEGARTFANKTATLSFWAKADSSKSISFDLEQNFGTGGSPSSAVNAIGATKINLTSSWQKFTATINISSISGKTLGSNGDDNLTILFWLDAGANYNSRTGTLGQQSGTFDIAQVQLEEGSTATPYEMRPIGIETTLCQRYYYATDSRTIFSGNVTSGSAYYIKADMKVTMRGIPTIVFTEAGAPSCFPAGNPSQWNVYVDGVGAMKTANATGAGFYYFYFTADAEL